MAAVFTPAIGTPPIDPDRSITNTTSTVLAEQLAVFTRLIRSIAGAGALLLKNLMVLLPAASVTLTDTVLTVVQLPVVFPLMESVLVLPFTLILAVRVAKSPLV